MSANDLLVMLYSIQNILEFIQKVTIKCSKPSCLINLLKALTASPDSLIKHLNEFRSHITQKFNTQLGHFELFSLVLLEFHDHELEHCGRTEEFCLYHNLFPYQFIRTCKCGKFSEFFPTVKADIFPLLQCKSSAEYLTEKVFRSFFRLNKIKSRVSCGCYKQYIVSEIPLFLMFGVENTSNCNLLNFFASVPSNLILSEIFDTDSEENYNLAGYLIVVNGSLQYFKKLVGIHLWEIGPVNNRKSTTFIDGIKFLLQSSILPVAIIYLYKSEPFYIEKQNFLCIEKLKLKFKDNSSEIEYAKKCQIGQSMLWICQCGQTTNALLCSCGQRREYWKCKCGVLCKQNTCVCGNSIPLCKYCKHSIKQSEYECRRCGGQAGCNCCCNVCGFDTEGICVGCYQLMEMCTICGFLNHWDGFACRRCMNPFKRVMQIAN